MHWSFSKLKSSTISQVILQHGEVEVRLEQDPFPLYPGEEIKVATTPLKVVPVQTALRLQVVRDFTDEVTKEERQVGEEYLFEGPGTFIPRKEVKDLGEVKAHIINPNEALKLKAVRETIDRNGNKRVAGEEWLVRKTGAYLPGAYEQLVDACKAVILTDVTAIHVRATKSFKDQMGKWAVKIQHSILYPGINL